MSGTPYNTGGAPHDRFGWAGAFGKKKIIYAQNFGKIGKIKITLILFMIFF